MSPFFHFWDQKRCHSSTTNYWWTCRHACMYSSCSPVRSVALTVTTDRRAWPRCFQEIWTAPFPVRQSPMDWRDSWFSAPPIRRRPMHDGVHAGAVREVRQRRIVLLRSWPFITRHCLARKCRGANAYIVWNVRILDNPIFVSLKFGLCWFVVWEKYYSFAEKYYSNTQHKYTIAQWVPEKRVPLIWIPFLPSEFNKN
jgi:hypothetical protein